MIRRDKALILVVDDDPGVRFLAFEALSQSGFEVLEAAGVTEAIAGFERMRPDMVLLDAVFPGASGFELCKSFKASPFGAKTPIVIMTGLDDTESIDRAYESGATDFITKPVNWTIVSHRLRYILRASATHRELCRSKTRLANAQRIAKLGHWDWDLETDGFQWSEELCRILDTTPPEVEAARRTLLDFIHPDDLTLVEQSLKQALVENEPPSIEYRVTLSNGSVRFVQQEVEVTCDENGKPVWLAGIVQDITERRRAEEQISFLAYYDSLTGLPNRVLFKKYLREALAQAQRYKNLLAILFLDVDLFKRFNDTFGHSTGDLLLKEAAERLARSIRESDCVARYDGRDVESKVARLGGDEFTVLLTKIAEVEDAARVAQRIVSAFSEPFHIESREIFMTASIGICLYPFDGQDIETLLKNADAAMYHAKSQGRNNYQFYTKSMNFAAAERFALESDLRKAIDRNELVLFYQPKLEGRTGRLTAVEALVRWKHPRFGLILPDNFIPLAEETGLILPISEWVLNKACAQSNAWRTAGFPPLRLAVNLSSVQFKEPKILIETIERALKSWNMDPHLLELELTESVLMAHEEESIITLRKLKSMGITISIDDFGMGYSSLSYLKRFPVDEIKIDKSFLKDIHIDNDTASLTSAIILMAHTLNLKAVAEGVETEHQLAFLREQGCDKIQGFLLGIPMPAEELTLLLTEGRYF